MKIIVENRNAREKNMKLFLPLELPFPCAVFKFPFPCVVLKIPFPCVRLRLPFTCVGLRKLVSEYLMKHPAFSARPSDRGKHPKIDADAFSKQALQ